MTALYDARSRQIVLRGASAYAEAHEHAHATQHAIGTPAWRLLESTRRIPVAGRLALLAVEGEAALLATSELMRCGIWRWRDGAEAVRGLASYVRALFVPKLL